MEMDWKVNGEGAFGDSSALEDLHKALGTAGTGDLGTTFADGTALRVESLEGTLKVVTYKAKALKLWNMLAKKPAYNTVEQYNILDSYGGAGNAFFEEGGVAPAEDSTYTRKTGEVKFMGVLREVTHAMTLVTPAHGNVQDMQAAEGTLWLIRKLNEALYYANDTYNPLAFKGIRQQIVDSVGETAENIVDCRGLPLSEDLLQDGARIIADNYSDSETFQMFAGMSVLSDIGKALFPRQRIGMPAPQNGVAGVPLTGFAADAGYINFNKEIFLRPSGGVPAAAVTGSPAAPVAPTMVAAAEATSRMDAGSYYYAVASINHRGESVATPSAAAVDVAAGEKVTVTVTRQRNAPAATGYKIYRGTTVAGLKYMKTVADPGGELATFTVVDLNADIPGTSEVFLFDMDGDQCMSYKQLAPLMKLPLAVVSAAFRFMILLYGVPQVYAPRKQVIFRNVGAYTD